MIAATICDSVNLDFFIITGLKLILLTSPRFREGYSEDQINWIQHFTFFRNLLVRDDNEIICTIDLDIALGTVIRLEIKNHDLQSIYRDNSSLFKCKINGPKDLHHYYTGVGYFDETRKPFLTLFHHTKSQFKDLIEESLTLKSSNWNFQGTKKLNNRSFIYFTSIDEIKAPEDLKQIAMSSDGKLLLLKDNFDIPNPLPYDFREKYKEGVLEIEVYRESTENRKATLEFHVDSTNIYTPNIWMHKPNIGHMFYELCNPYIFRVGLESNGSLEYIDNIITSQTSPIQEYVVIGDCTTLKGLEAPLDEENTDEIFKIELLHGKVNILEFWFQEGNKDLFTDRDVTKFGFDK